MAKTSALSSGGEAIHTRTDAAGTAESQVAVLGIDGSDSVVGVGGGTEATALRVTVANNSTGVLSVDDNGDSLSVDDGGGTLSVDDGGGSLTVDNAALTVVGGGTEATALRVTVANNSTGVIAATGNVASGNADSGNPVKVGGKYNATFLALANGDRSDIQVGARGSLKAQLMAADSNTAIPTGGGVETDALRVTIANDSTGVVSVDDSGGSLTVDNSTLSVTGGGTEASALRVTVATNSTGVLSVDDNGGSLTVDSPALDVLTVTGGGSQADAQRVTIANDSTGVLSVDDNGNSLTVDGGVDILTLPGSLTGKAEGTAALSGDVGILNLGIRNDTPSVLTGTDGEYTIMAVDKYGRTQIAPVRSLPKSIQVSGSLGITTAATWDERAAWAVPASTLFAPKMARCAVTTAATRTLICAGKRLGTFNPNTNAFVADGSVSGNDFYDRMFYRINVTHSATATNVTATYTDQAGASSTSGALVIVASAAAGDWYEFVLAAGDFGVQSVTNITDTAAPTSVTDEIWGVRTLLEDNGPANTPHIAYLGEGLQIPTGETVFILFNAAATTAQVRFASILGDLVAA